MVTVINLGGVGTIRLILSDVVDGFALGLPFGFVGEVVFSDGKAELSVFWASAEVITGDKTYGGDFALCRKRENVGGIEEKVLAEVSCGAGFLTEVVISDEEKGSLGVVGHISHDMAELGCDAYTAERHEMVNVVNDDQFGV